MITLYRWLGDADLYSKRQIAMKDLRVSNPRRRKQERRFQDFMSLASWRNGERSTAPGKEKPDTEEEQ